MPRVDWVEPILSCIDPIRHTEKLARKVSLNALRSRISGLCVGDDQSMGLWSCKCESTVDAGFRGSAMKDMLAGLDSVCADGTKCDICKIGEPVINISQRDLAVLYFQFMITAIFSHNAFIS